jgi:hypothetical protein
MQKEGASLELKAYNNEATATADFRSGQCDALMATAFRTREFNGVAASIDTLGATTVIREGRIDMPASYDVVRKVVQTFAAPQAAGLMSQCGTEVGGIFPFGAAYPMVRDRSINTVEALAGKKIASFAHDKAQSLMIQRIKAQPVSADINNFATQFNAGGLDMIAAPTLAYKPLELNKGLGTKGAVHRFPLTILTYQMIFRPDRFPAGFGQKSREVWFSRFDQVIQLTRKADATIPSSFWMSPSPADADRYVQLMRDGRIAMADKGFYDKRGLKILKRIRCDVNPSGAECSLPTEAW